MVDIDKILLEWSWRCEKGYPDLNTAKDLATLKQVLKEMNLPSIDINGPATAQLQEAKPKKDAKLQAAIDAAAPLFTIESITKLGYASYATKIETAFNSYITGNPDLEVLKYFVNGEVNVLIDTPDNLSSFIKLNQKDELLISLYNIAAKEKQAGKPETGRGAMGRGEVLIGMLTQAHSGGTAKEDNIIGGVPFEVKAAPSTSIKIPLAAKRIDRLTSLNKLDDVYAACKSFIEYSNEEGGNPWETYVQEVFKGPSNKLASKFDKDLKAGGKYIFDAGLAPSSGNINGQELVNFEVFFKSLNEKLSKSSESESPQEYYVDLDSIITSHPDKYFKGIVTSPKQIGTLVEGDTITIKVVEGNSTATIEQQRMETRLRQLDYIKNPENFRKDLRTDCEKLLGHSFIVFHEVNNTSTEVPIPVLLKPADALDNDKIKIVNFSLNAAALNFAKAVGAKAEPEEKQS